MSAVSPILRITPWRGLWRISLDGQFFGDYQTVDEAATAAKAAQAVMIALGGRAEIVVARD